MKIIFQIDGGIGKSVMATAVGNGELNGVRSDSSFVGGGTNNNINSGDNSFIGGGEKNYVYKDYNVMVGGTNNCTNSDHAAVVSGDANNASGPYSFIGGGDHNRIATSGDHAMILGGDGNNASGDHSVILGGTNNDDNGLPYVGIFGQNINNPADIKPNTLHVNNLFASDASGTTNIYLVNLPTSPGFPLSGLLWNNGGVVMVS